MNTRLPCLLNESCLDRAILHPIRLNVSRVLTGLSTAVMLLPESDPEISVRDLVRIEDGFGDAMIFRVRTVTQEVGLRRRVSLEHALATLSDDMLPSLTYADTLPNVLNTMLSYQTNIRWAVGDVDDADLTISAIGQPQTIYAAMNDLLDMLPQELSLSFDQTQQPWRLHLRRLPTEITCEGRLTRGLSTVRITRDAGSLCTRVYPYGCGQGLDRVSLMPLLGRDYLDADTIGTWGIAARTFTSDQIMDSDTLKSVAERYLARHCTPSVTVEVKAVDLSRITGEPLDTFRLGQNCRLVLPDGTVLTERISVLHTPDVFGMPGQVTMTLADREISLSDEIAGLLRDVSASKLIGGKLTDLVFRNRASGTYTSPIVHYFTLDEYPSVLSCTMAMRPDSGVTIQTIMIDGVEIAYSVWKTLTFDALPYLKRSATGAVAAGQHALLMMPTNPGGGINTVVTLKVIEKISG